MSEDGHSPAASHISSSPTEPRRAGEILYVMERRTGRGKRDEIARQSLREYFFRTELARLRRRAMIEAARRGVALSEDEIFKQVL